MSYVIEKELNCLGHAVVNSVARTALPSVPDRTDRILIQCLSGTFYFSDSPNLPTDLTTDGLRLPANSTFLYHGNRSNFFYLGNALLLYYSSK